ncbi:hypothetical protein ACFX1X_019027 [Malus domestica]
MLLKMLALPFISNLYVTDVISSCFPCCSRFVHFWRPNNSRGADTDDGKSSSPSASRGLGKSINPGLLNCCITGLLTLVSQDDDITALQVRNLSDEWISAPPVLGTFVCNIGDMLKIYSNGLYESTLHQVINSSPKYRVCVAYLYEE